MAHPSKLCLCRTILNMWTCKAQFKSKQTPYLWFGKWIRLNRWFADSPFHFRSHSEITIWPLKDATLSLLFLSELHRLSSPTSEEAKETYLTELTMWWKAIAQQRRPFSHQYRIIYLAGFPHVSSSSEGLEKRLFFFRFLFFTGIISFHIRNYVVDFGHFSYIRLALWVRLCEKDWKGVNLFFFWRGRKKNHIYTFK